MVKRLSSSTKTCSCYIALLRLHFFRMGPPWELDRACESSIRQPDCPQAYDQLHCQKQQVIYHNGSISNMSYQSCSFLRGFDYVVNSKGLLKSISPCQCLPKTEGTSLAISGIQFACPVGKLDPVSAKVVYKFSS